MSEPNVNPSPSAGSPPLDSNFLSDTAWIPSQIGAQTDDAGQPIEGQVQPSLISPELIAQCLGPSFKALFHAIASQRGSHWELQPDEKIALVQGWTPIAQYLLSKLGNQEQVLLSLAVMSTAAIVGGKVVQDGIRRASSMASTRTPESGASTASSENATPASPLEPKNSYAEPSE